MTRRVLDFNPQTGETTYFDYNEAEGTPQATISYTQDVTDILKQCAEWRSKTDTKTDYGIKQDMWHYARIPNSVIMEMKTKHGVDFFDEADKAKVYHLINTEYAQFKTTHKNHMSGTDRKYFISDIKDV
jgi:hypothetical protein